MLTAFTVTLLLGLLTVAGCATPPSTSKLTPESTGRPVDSQTTKSPFPPSESTQSPLKIVVYTDFECGACEKFHSQVEPKLRQRYVATGKAEIEIRLLAVIGDGSIRAAQAALWARDQGRFQEFADALFSAWTRDGTDAYSVEALTSLAASLGMDTATFARDMNSEAKKAELEKNLSLAGGDKVRTLPAVIIGGSKIEGFNPLETYERIIEGKLAGQQTLEQPPPTAEPSAEGDSGEAPAETASPETPSQGTTLRPPSQLLRDMTIDLLAIETWAAQTFTTPPRVWTVGSARVGTSTTGSPPTALAASIRATDADGYL